MPNIFVVGGNRQIEKMFSDEGWELCDNVSDADLVQFTGGEDVDPVLYHQHKHPTTNYNSSRDAMEQEVYLSALEQGVKMAGICRGGQFLNVMNGGRLYQNVDGHGLHGTHEAIIVSTGEIVNVTSTHHQMMIPSKARTHEVLLTADVSTRREFMTPTTSLKLSIVNTPTERVGNDIEAVIYHQSNCLCFQPHPEYHDEHVKETREVFFNFIDILMDL